MKGYTALLIASCLISFTALAEEVPQIQTPDPIKSESVWTQNKAIASVFAMGLAGLMGAAISSDNQEKGAMIGVLGATLGIAIVRLD